jgi:hypothetical protein
VQDSWTVEFSTAAMGPCCLKYCMHKPPQQNVPTVHIRPSQRNSKDDNHDDGVSDKDFDGSTSSLVGHPKAPKIATHLMLMIVQQQLNGTSIRRAMAFGKQRRTKFLGEEILHFMVVLLTQLIAHPTESNPDFP